MIPKDWRSAIESLKRNWTHTTADGVEIYWTERPIVIDGRVHFVPFAAA